MEAAIVSFAEGSLEILLRKLGSLLAQEAVKLWGVRDDIQELRDELESMSSFIQKHARKEDLDEQVKTWIKQVREMAYDIEDCIDEFMHHVGSPIEDGYLHYPRRGIRLVRTLKPRCEIVSKIHNLKIRIHSVSARQSRYMQTVISNIEIGGSSSSCVAPKLRTLLSKEGEVVGIEDRTDKIVRWLVDDNVLDLRVISIVGFGGFGKTILAMTAYESSTVKRGHFQCRAQISLSQKFNLNEIFRDTLRQVFPPPESQMTREGEITWRNPLENIEKMNEFELGSKLSDHLKDKRYVIFIDDIWTESAWNSIKFAFPDNNNGSRIIVTTRIKSVAEFCSFPHHDYLYQIKPLSKKDSESLFFKKIFGSSNECPPELEQVSNDILKKCGGMPLAIVSIAGLLSVKPNKTIQEWKSVYASLGSELETNPSLEGIRKILNLSYHDLPYHLKTCFLYLSIFPEDYTIERKKLVRRWVAEGFVSRKRGVSEEQVAKSYFDEFLNRNLIQPMDFGIDGCVKTCRVHDMILELIVSMSVKENLVFLAGGEYDEVPSNNIRRMSVQSTEQNINNFGLNHVRSVSTFTTIKISLPSFGVLRVLSLEGLDLQNDDLKYVGNFFLLKYLGLRNNWSLSKLPTEIGKLQYLEMLDIKNTQISKLPKEIFNMQNLKHFIGPSWHPIYTSKLGNLRSIKTLTGVFFKNGIPKSLENFKHLNKLSFKIDLNSREELLDLKLSPNLYSLKILRLRGPMPSCMASLQYLIKLTINGLFVTDINMQTLGNLPKLLSLKIVWPTHPLREVIRVLFPTDLFKTIKLFQFSYNETFEMIFAERTAPNLERLTVCLTSQCIEDDLECITVTGMEHLLNLKEVKVSYYCDTKPTLVDKIKRDATEHPAKPNFIEDDCSLK